MTTRKINKTNVNERRRQRRRKAHKSNLLSAQIAVVSLQNMFTVSSSCFERQTQIRTIPTLKHNGNTNPFIAFFGIRLRLRNANELTSAAIFQHISINIIISSNWTQLISITKLGSLFLMDFRCGSWRRNDRSCIIYRGVRINRWGFLFVLFFLSFFFLLFLWFYLDVSCYSLFCSCSFSLEVTVNNINLLYRYLMVTVC